MLYTLYSYSGPSGEYHSAGTEGGDRVGTKALLRSDHKKGGPFVVDDHKKGGPFVVDGRSPPPHLARPLRSHYPLQAYTQAATRYNPRHAEREHRG